MQKIILATTSKSRIKSFKKLSIPFKSEGSSIDEYFNGRPKDPQDLVLLLSKLKAESVAKNHASGIVIGMDSVGYFKSEILEKPKSREEAKIRLSRISGSTLLFHTGIYIKNIGKQSNLSKVVTTKVRIREISTEEIDRYLDEDPSYNTYALGFNPSNYYSCTFVLSLEGSYNNFLYGLPIEQIVLMLKEI